MSPEDFGGLPALLTGLAAELGDVAADAQAGALRYARAGKVFAVARGESVELRLRADVADAALRTPDTAPSDRGEEWIAFTPPSWADPLARDRLVAWFRLAWRVAG